MDNQYKYDIAISFANEDRNAALALSLALEMAGFQSVYYYTNHLAATAGRNLKPAIRKIFAEESKYIVVLVSEKYLKKAPYSLVKTELSTISQRVRKDRPVITVIIVKLSKKISFSRNSVLQSIGHIGWDFDPKKVTAILKETFGAIPSKDQGELFEKKITWEFEINQTNKAGVARNQENNLTVKI